MKTVVEVLQKLLIGASEAKLKMKLMMMTVETEQRMKHMEKQGEGGKTDLENEVEDKRRLAFAFY